ncbi:MAG TPA: nicotinamide-nucleotide amidohydrolase family protein [Rhodoglobus sp.]|nr:nicotinamide-nucleotide amidohydrolase family protein [Rhodoglobus sp.]
MTTSAEIIATLIERGYQIAVAESLTGGLLVAELIDTPGASQVVVGGVVAYNTELKASVLNVDAGALAEHGAVHPDVAAQMATGVRAALALAAGPPHIGISTTGVAGPEPQDGQSVGTVYLGFAIGGDVSVKRLSLTGSRADIRSATVSEALSELARLLR